jgi:hypothetical protein
MPNEPIILATLEGRIDVETMKQVFAQSAALADGMRGRIYRITDVRRVSNAESFTDIIAIVREAAKGMPGSTTDPRIVPMFVGTHQMAKLAADLLRQQQFGGKQVPMFKSVEDALDFVGLQIPQTRILPPLPMN